MNIYGYQQKHKGLARMAKRIKRDIEGSKDWESTYALENRLQKIFSSSKNCQEKISELRRKKNEKRSWKKRI